MTRGRERIRVTPRGIALAREGFAVRCCFPVSEEPTPRRVFLQVGKREVEVPAVRGPTAGEQIFATFLATGPGPKWIRLFAETPAGEREALGGFLGVRWGRRPAAAPTPGYDDFLRATEPDEQDLANLAEKAGRFPRRPLVSVLLPTYNTDPVFLRRAIESVRAQLYDRWELCIADDASTREDTRKALRALAAEDPRIRVVFRPRNGHIAAASNSALRLARGEFVALLDHDDELAPAALARMVEAINRDPGLRFLYSDEDKIDPGGHRSGPYLKPDWNPTLLRSQNYLCHLAFVARADLEAVGGFREGTEGCQDWDLFLRLGEHLPASAIRHVPAVLYHWRMIPGSTAVNVGEKDYVVDRARRILGEREGKGAAAGSWEKVAGMYWVHHPEPAVEVRSVPLQADGPVEDPPATASPDTVLVFHPEQNPPDSATAALLAGWARQPGTGMVAGALRRADGGIGEAGLLLQPEGGLQPLFCDLPPDFEGMGRRELLPQELVVPGRWWFALRAGLWPGTEESSGGSWTYRVARLALTLRDQGLHNLLVPSLGCTGEALTDSLRAGEAEAIRSAAPALCARDPGGHPHLTTEHGFLELSPRRRAGPLR
jgi:hypothetical protein